MLTCPHSHTLTLKPLLFAATFLLTFIPSSHLWSPGSGPWLFISKPQQGGDMPQARHPFLLSSAPFPFCSTLRCSHLHLPNFPVLSSGRKIRPVAHRAYHHAFQHCHLSSRSLWLSLSLSCSLSLSLACFLSFFSFFLSLCQRCYLSVSLILLFSLFSSFFSAGCFI